MFAHLHVNMAQYATRTAETRVAICHSWVEDLAKYRLPFFCRIDGKILVKIKMMFIRLIHIANMII